MEELVNGVCHISNCPGRNRDGLFTLCGCVIRRRYSFLESVSAYPRTMSTSLYIDNYD